MFNKIINFIVSIMGMKFFLRKYIVSAEVIREHGKKITVLTLSGSALLKDGIADYHFAGGLCATVGNTIIALDTVKSSASENDLGFFLTHEVGHLVLGHVDKAVKNGDAGTVLVMDDEVAADNYARSKGFTTPDFRKLLSGVYGEVVSAGFLTAETASKLLEATLGEHASRM